MPGFYTDTVTQALTLSVLQLLYPLGSLPRPGIISPPHHLHFPLSSKHWVLSILSHKYISKHFPSSYMPLPTFVWNVIVLYFLESLCNSLESLLQASMISVNCKLVICTGVKLSTTFNPCWTCLNPWAPSPTPHKKKMNKKQIISLKSSKSSPFIRGKSPVYQVGMVGASMVWSFLAKLTSPYHLDFLSRSHEILRCLEGRACSLLWAVTREVPTTKNTLFVSTLPCSLFHISNLQRCHLEDLLG